MAEVSSRRAEFSNRVRGLEKVFGLFVRTPRHELVEVLGRTALDFVVLDAEHAPFDRVALDTCLLAAAAVDLPVLVRVPGAGSELCTSALDLGADGLLVPHVDDVATARAAVRTSRYGSPSGRGLSLSTRAASYGQRGFHEHISLQNSRCLVVCQLETSAAVIVAREIAAEEGVDAVFFGRMDLAASSDGLAPDDSSLDDAALSVRGAARAAGKASGLIIGGRDNFEVAQSSGATLFVLGTEQALLTRQVESRLDELRGGDSSP